MVGLPPLRSRRTRHRSGRPAVQAAGAALALTGLLLSGCSGGSGGGHRSADHRAGPSASGRTSGDGAPRPAVTPPLPDAVPAALKRYYAQKPAWKACGGGLDGLQCAKISVPLDYDHPGAGDIPLELGRKQAPKPAKGSKAAGRIGSLLVNPGGPGGSGLDYLQYAAIGFPKAVTDRYDMVSFDPRGVGRSDPITCLSDKQMDAYTEVDATPDTPAEVTALQNQMKAFAHGCETHSGKLLPHVSTVDAARDMDVVRAVVGDPKLNYVGKSYGTFLGATYAELFPKHTGRIVLDGALDPSLTALQSNRAQAGGFQTAFDAFAKYCAGNRGCPLGKSSARAGSELNALFTRLDKKSIPTKRLGGRKLDEALATTGVLSALYAKQEWPALRAALASAEKGDGTGLLKLSDEYYERDGKGHYGNLMYANSAVNCLDAPPAITGGPAQVEQTMASFRKASPQFGTNMAWMGLSCAYWPVKSTGVPHRITAPGSAPIVVVGTTRDPATPYAWAKSLAGQLSRGHLLTYRGDGHTAYGMGSSCIDTAVNTFLLKGRPPAQGKTC